MEASSALKERIGGVHKERFQMLPTLRPHYFERIENLKKLNIEAIPKLSIKRSVLYTGSYKETEGLSVPLRRAHAVASVLEGIPIDINEYELLVGAEGPAPRTCHHWPEVWGSWFEKELDTISTREWNPLQISEEEKKALREEVIPYWGGKNIEEVLFNRIPKDMKAVWYANPDTDTQECCFIGSIVHMLVLTIEDYNVNHKGLLEKGLKGFKEKAREELRTLDLRSHPSAFKKHDMLSAFLISLNSVSKFIMRYAGLARQKAEKEANPKRKEELESISRGCRWISENPPRTFPEALQLAWFAIVVSKLEGCCHSTGLGRFDRLFYPFYKKDKEEGRLTDEEALELIECLWIKFADCIHPRPEAFSRIVGGYGIWQIVVVGGQDAKGNDSTNELSYLALQATADTRLHQPDISVRVHSGSPDEFLKKAGEVVCLGTGHPKFYNDEALIPSIVDMGKSHGGIPLEIIREEYFPLGCVESAVGYRMGYRTPTTFTNLPACVEMALSQGASRIYKRRFGLKTPDPRTFKSFDEFFQAVKDQYYWMKDECKKINNLSDRVRGEIMALPFLSSLREDMIEQGTDLMMDACTFSGPYNHHHEMASGAADLFDSLAAVKKVVFDDEKITMAELVDALDGDFEGKEEIRSLLINAPKYGNDDDYADYFAELCAQMITGAAAERYQTPQGAPRYTDLLSVTINVVFGSVLGSLPNGRKAKMPLADASGPSHGSDKQGPTAVMRSVGKMARATHRQRTQVYNLLNMRFTPDILFGEGGLDNLLALIRTYFDYKGAHVQFNVMSSETLRDAQNYPEKYPDLLVRVAGYSAYFTQLSKVVQDDIIGRTEQTGW